MPWVANSRAKVPAVLWTARKVVCNSPSSPQQIRHYIIQHLEKFFPIPSRFPELFLPQR